VTGRPKLAWLAPGAPPDAFPDPAQALREPNGLLAAGGDLGADRLLAAYRRGIFPWFSEGQPILWWCPDPRAVLLPSELHLSRRLRRSLRAGRFEVSVDRRFGEVIGLCASTRRESGTWLTPAMVGAYRELHERGFAHSVESWCDGELAGGIYGVALGGAFFGESMVSLRPDGSKVALAKLVALAREQRIELIDCQMPNPHLVSLGSRSIPRRRFLERLERLAAAEPLHRIRTESRASGVELAQL
jgi:leucyl/phenylalanyl-tRNA--protein transferase